MFCLLWMRCVVQVHASATGRSLVQGSPTECVCVHVCVIRLNNNPVHVQWVGRKGRTKRNQITTITYCIIIIIKPNIKGIHKRMVRFICIYTYKPHHSFVYTLYIWRYYKKNGAVYIYIYIYTYKPHHSFVYILYIWRYYKKNGAVYMYIYI